jgi:myo-inositol 2-dehydrogenase/D-chiro-inositol 1-dehydrogenase
MHARSAVAAGNDKSPVRVGVLGAGRIGRLHARLLAREVDGATLVAVADAVPDVARGVADQLGVAAWDVDEVLAASDVDAVAVCTSTDTHVDLVVRAAKAGKAIFCEKPVSLDLGQVDMALADVESAGVPFMVGFNRRFDPGHRAVHDAARSGALGELHLVRISSRDPVPPPPEYVAVSGGLFLDMAIHDFDMARFVVGSEVVEVFARGAVRVDHRIGEAGDVDTAVTVLTHADGTITTIDNSRRAVYGYDQRVEAFGSAGMALSDNPPRHNAFVRAEAGTIGQALPWFFLDRYLESYRREWAAFVSYVRAGGQSPVDGESARAPIAIGLAATRSLHERRPIRLDDP